MHEPRRILLAEDDRFLRRAAEATLRKHGYAVIAAGDGEEALRLAQSERPDVILLDVIMPKMQGFEVLSRLKADSATRAIPVIMLSNLSQPSDIQESADRGAVAYLVKSNVKLDELVAKVTAVLEAAAG